MKKILLIDDDPSNLDIITEVLTIKGYDVVAMDRCMPVSSVIDLHPNLVIVDHHLLGQSGGDFCLSLKQNPQSRNIPVVMVSTRTDLKEISKNRLADGFLEKPFNIEDLENIAEKFAV